MPDARSIPLDAVIFGGGATGLWTLDVLVRAGYAVLLLEAGELGAGQTVVSQGIIHGGLKYTLDGLLSPSARSLRDMPRHWRRCLAGEQDPDLSAARRRADFCHLWRTDDLGSRMALFGARRGLQTATQALDRPACPPVLRACPGSVARLEEQVVEPDSFLSALATHHPDRILAIDAKHGLDIERNAPGAVKRVRLIDPASGAPLDLDPERVILAAGAGNAALRESCGLDAELMQRRPLHMVLARGDLPVLNGHCVDGMRTRATITTTRDFADRVVWQIGGQVAERGVEMEPATLVRHAAAELRAILPGVRLEGVEWTTYRVDRAEARTRGRQRPAGPHVSQNGNVISTWPTKLALVPVIADMILDRMPAPGEIPDPAGGILTDWTRPRVAAPPWEEDLAWIAGDGRLDLSVSPIGFGAFKIGRNQKIKYAAGYELPDEASVRALIEGVIALGINLVDTAPAYGLSEERLGVALGSHRDELVLSSKAGETFEDGVSHYDFSSSGLRRSVQRSLRRLQTDHLDILLIHSDGRDVDILEQTDAVQTLHDLRDAGLARAIGLSATTAEGARMALSWADVLMVEYHLEARDLGPVLADAVTAGTGVLVKKALASGRLDPRLAIPFALAPASVASVVIGGLDLGHIEANVRLAEQAERDGPAPGRSALPPAADAASAPATKRERV